jgi:hypothetical protein
MKKMIFIFGLLAACTPAPDKAEQKLSASQMREKLRRDSLIQKMKQEQEPLQRELDSLLKKKEELLRR